MAKRTKAAPSAQSISYEVAHFAEARRLMDQARPLLTAEQRPSGKAEVDAFLADEPQSEEAEARASAAIQADYLQWRTVATAVAETVERLRARGDRDELIKSVVDAFRWPTP
jgi:hypothetical protein